MCGIFGIINAKPTLFNINKFCTLGAANDARGGDSTGIMIDGDVEYGIEENKLFEDFFDASSLLSKKHGKAIHIALGHCRKASVGSKTLENAHPICIYDKDGQLEFCLIHNGTIKNYAELAAKYEPDFNIEGLSDTRVMTYLLYKGHLSVLQEYIGGSVFVWVDYRDKKPKVFLFQGAQKKVSHAYKYGSYFESYYDSWGYGAATESKIPSVEEETVLEPERPFYLVKTPTGITFSSLYSPLNTLHFGYKVFKLQYNTLYSIVEGKVTKAGVYDRKDTPFGAASVKSTCSCSTGTTTAKTTAASGKESKEEKKEEVESPRVATELHRHYLQSKCIFNTKKWAITLNGEVLHGPLRISDYGYKALYQPESYFFAGIPLKNKESYLYLIEKWKTVESEGVTLEKFKEENGDLLAYMSDLPMPIQNGEDTLLVTVAMKNEKAEVNSFTGDFFVPYASELYHVNTNGEVLLKSCSYNEGLTKTWRNS